MGISLLVRYIDVQILFVIPLTWSHFLSVLAHSQPMKEGVTYVTSLIGWELAKILLKEKNTQNSSLSLQPTFIGLKTVDTINILNFNGNDVKSIKFWQAINIFSA